MSMNRKQRPQLDKIDICKALFNKAMNCDFDDSGINFSADQYHNDSFKLLSAFPGIIAVMLATQTGDDEHVGMFNRIIDILSDEMKIPEMLSALERVISIDLSIEAILTEANNFIDHIDLQDEKQKITKEITSFLPKLAEILILLFHPKAVHLRDSDVCQNLIFSLSKYFILLIMLDDSLRRKNESFYLKLGNVENIEKRLHLSKGTIKKRFSNKLNIFYLSSIPFLLTLSKAAENIYDFIDEEWDELDHEENYRKSPIPGTKYSILKWPKNELPKVGLVIHKIKNKDEIFGFGININQSNSDDDNLWIIIPSIDVLISEDEFKVETSFYLEKDLTEKGVLHDLVGQLHNTSQESYSLARSLLDLWDDFLAAPQNFIKSDLDSIIDWITQILENDRLSEQVFQYTALFNQFTSVNKYFRPSTVEKSKYDETIRSLLKVFRKYIPPDLLKILRDAEEEFELFCFHLKRKSKKDLPIGKTLGKISGVRTKRKKVKITDKKELRDIKRSIFADNTFEYILEEDLDIIKWETEKSEKRGAKGMFLVRVAERKGGRELTQDIIFEKLGIPKR